ncbi:MAG: choice-of-anchor J domain-containing protein [Verrucomicrobiota bacterium JB023]|nr:choice-of-anchor J domain-containing protein [Verrucomicrobiota bacterium JB023]
MDLQLMTQSKKNQERPGAASSSRQDLRSLPSPFSLGSFLAIASSLSLHALEITQNANGTDLDFTWVSTEGATYSILSSTDLSLPLDDWETVVEGETADESGTNTLTLARPEADSTFYVLEESNPVILLSTDFEDNNAGFTVTNDGEGSVWEYGTPNSYGFTVEVTSGNNDSSRAWGTGLSVNNGQYAVNTITRLRTPVIDLTNFTSASLSFAEAVDVAMDDTAEVYLIDDETGALLETEPLHASTPDPNFFSSDWGSVGPIELPASAYGQPVRLEFRFIGSGGLSANFMGWYIDDVTVVAE